MEEMDLLRKYVEGHDQEAFAQLVRLHGDWVYTAAKRQLGDAHLAEDVTQAVFVLLAGRSQRLRNYSYLGGWLFGTLRYCVKEARRQRGRQRKREQEAAAMRQQRVAEADWEEMAPVLEEAMAGLSGSDRDAVVLRFYQRKSMAEVGSALGISEEAAKKRVQRAVEKLRGVLANKGVMAGAGLAVVMMGKVTEAAPAGLVERVMGAVEGGGMGTVAGVIAKGAMKMMLWTKAKLAVVAIAMALVGAVGAAEVVTHSGDRPSMAATTAPVSDEGGAARPTTVPTGPKAGLLALVEHASSMDAKGVMDCFYAETPGEQQFVKAYAEDIVAQERFARAMESRFGSDDRYSLMGAGNTVARLPMDRATERVTGDRGVVEAVLAVDNTMSIPMRRVEGKWRIPVGEMWDAIRAMASKMGGKVPSMEQVIEGAERTTPAHLRLADAVSRGSYKSADAALAALKSDLAAANTAAATRSSR